ncbi:MAG: hypothetical protein ACXWC9_04085 [Pseudobdellovibrionaceae bacterium]
MVTKGGQADFVSGGNQYEIKYLLKESPIHLVGPRSQLETYKENLVIRKIFNQVSQDVYDLLHSRKFPEAGFKSADEAFKARNTALDKGIARISAKAKKLLDESGTPSGIAIENLNTKTKNYGLDFEMDPNGRLALKPEIEKQIVNKLGNGEELVLNYFHLLEYTKRINGRDGYLDLPDHGDPISAELALKNKQGGSHAIALVDVIRDSSGRIQYFVVRNSWGIRRRTDNGYNYISLAYLKQYGAEVTEWSIDAISREKILEALNAQEP